MSRTWIAIVGVLSTAPASAWGENLEPHAGAAAGDLGWAERLAAPGVLPQQPIQEPAPPAPPALQAPYVGGRGLITLEGVTGMFLYPTSGTLPQGTIGIQYCVAWLEQNDDTEVQHTAMLAYGLCDFLEVGVMGRVSDLDNDDQYIAAGGPFLRWRLLQDEPATWMPELSLGFIARLGHTNLDKKTFFAAASKRLPLDEDGLLRSFRPHLGMRYLWQGSNNDGPIGYLGGEIELPQNIFVVAEVSTRGELFTRTPFSIGAQWRPSNFLGLSLAGVQTGGDDRMGLYFGIGIDY